MLKFMTKTTPNADDCADESMAVCMREEGGGKEPAQKKTKMVQFNKGVASRTAKAKPEHTLFFADFVERVMDGVGDSVFVYVQSGSPLATKSASLRGTIAEEVVKRAIGLEIGHDAIFPADGSKCVDGTKRGAGKEEYDFGVRVTDGSGSITKVEVKLARLGFDTSQRGWRVQFMRVKPDSSDMVLLVLEGLESVRVYKWDGGNVSTTGKSTFSTGHNITIYGPRNEPDFETAYNDIAIKLDERNYFADPVHFTDPQYADLFSMTTRTEDVMNHVPLATLSFGARGAALEKLARAVLRDTIGAVVADATVTDCVNGVSRGKKATEYDFVSDGLRVEVKSAMLAWDKNIRRFQLRFVKVKPECFDTLVLVWLTPRGVHVFEHDAMNGYSTNGKATESSGGEIKMYAPAGKTGYKVWSAAETFFLKQLKWFGSKYIAFVAFAEGDADKVLEYGAKHGNILGGGDEEAEDDDGVMPTAEPEDDGEEEEEGDGEDLE
jgi:hypothetical protein